MTNSSMPMGGVSPLSSGLTGSEPVSAAALASAVAEFASRNGEALVPAYSALSGDEPICAENLKAALDALDAKLNPPVYAKGSWSFVKQTKYDDVTVASSGVEFAGMEPFSQTSDSDSARLSTTITTHGLYRVAFTANTYGYTSLTVQLPMFSESIGSSTSHDDDVVVDTQIELTPQGSFVISLTSWPNFSPNGLSGTLAEISGLVVELIEKY